MANFDWFGFLELAEALSNSAAASPLKTLQSCGSEACHRTIISRAYYAVFCSTRELLLKRGAIQEKSGRDSHETVWKALNVLANANAKLWLRENDPTFDERWTTGQIWARIDDLADDFGAIPPELERRLGEEGGTLKSQRTRADYIARFPGDLAKKTEEVLLQAADLQSIIKQLSA